MADFTTMSGPELVREYNRLAAERGLPLVRRFATTADGRRRCQRLLANGAVHEEADVFTVFNTSTRKNRGKLLKALNDKKGQQVPLASLIKSVYDSTNPEKRGALQMVMRGLEQSIQKYDLKYRIEKSKTETGAISYGFYDKA
jgi:hypothetical protein